MCIRTKCTPLCGHTCLCTHTFLHICAYTSTWTYTYAYKWIFLDHLLSILNRVMTRKVILAIGCFTEFLPHTLSTTISPTLGRYGLEKSINLSSALRVAVSIAWVIHVCPSPSDHNGSHAILLVLSPFSNVLPSVAPWTVACRAPLSMGFSGQEYWSGFPYPPLGGLPDPGIKVTSPTAPASQLDS